MATRKSTKKSPKRRVAQVTPVNYQGDDGAQARAERREQRLAVLKPFGMTNANYVTKPDVDNILAVAEKVGAGKGTKADKAACKELCERIRSNSLKLTDNAKGIVRPFALAEQVEAFVNAS